MPKKSKAGTITARATRAFATADVPRESKTIMEFCAAWRISPSFYYKMQEKGKGPRETRLLQKKIIITNENEAKWALECEKASAKECAKEAAAKKQAAATKQAARKIGHASVAA